MNNKANIQIHFIFGNALISKEWTCHVPHPGDEVRFGGDGNEKYYKVERVVWVYDEPENPFERVNIGVTESKYNGQNQRRHVAARKEHRAIAVR